MEKIPAMTCSKLIASVVKAIGGDLLVRVQRSFAPDAASSVSVPTDFSGGALVVIDSSEFGTCGSGESTWLLLLQDILAPFRWVAFTSELTPGAAAPEEPRKISFRVTRVSPGVDFQKGQEIEIDAALITA